MPRPQLSQFADPAEFAVAIEAWHVKLHDLANEVDRLAEEMWGVQDAGDLCYNLMDLGVIAEDTTAEEAARATYRKISLT